MEPTVRCLHYYNEKKINALIDSILFLFFILPRKCQGLCWYNFRKIFENFYA